MHSYPIYVKKLQHFNYAILIQGYSTSDWNDTYHQFSDKIKTWTCETGFKVDPRTYCLIFDNNGKLETVLYGKSVHGTELFYDGAWLLSVLPGDKTYKLQEEKFTIQALEHFALTWQLATYSFNQYQQSTKTFPTLLISDDIIIKNIALQCHSIFMVRDLINRPANDLNPETFVNYILTYAHHYNMKYHVTSDQELETEYPLVYGVGKGAATPPAFVELEWGSINHPKVTLIGKGITFDTGGLDIKTSGHMLLMKKDMAGAAHALGLGSLIASEKLPIHLIILIPIAENAVGPSAMRPGDVLRSRKGLTVEIKDTDAEGRLLLADALTRASELNSTHIIDFATLTGAARVALGTEVPAFFSNDAQKSLDLCNLAFQENDPLWQLPLWKNYEKNLISSVANISNMSNTMYGGAITAALFLQKFVDPTAYWTHIDMMAWNLNTMPGRPEGGEAMGIRSLFHHLKTSYPLCSS